MNMAHIMQTSTQSEKILKTLTEFKKESKMMIRFRCNHSFMTYVYDMILW